ncbi:MAG: hypothetical protein V1745_00165, partial [Patescibacteria group bacterium]
MNDFSIPVPAEKKSFRRYLLIAGGIITIAIAITAAILAQVQLSYAGRIFPPDASSVPSADVAI